MGSRSGSGRRTAESIHTFHRGNKGCRRVVAEPRPSEIDHPASGRSNASRAPVLVQSRQREQITRRLPSVTPPYMVNHSRFEEYGRTNPFDRALRSVRLDFGLMAFGVGVGVKLRKRAYSFEVFKEAVRNFEDELSRYARYGVFASGKTLLLKLHPSRNGRMTTAR